MVKILIRAQLWNKGANQRNNGLNHWIKCFRETNEVSIENVTKQTFKVLYRYTKLLFASLEIWLKLMKILKPSFIMRAELQIHEHSFR